MLLYQIQPSVSDIEEARMDVERNKRSMFKVF
jgi:hypothetical protein